MGFLIWLQKKGSTGSIASWVVKQHNLLKSNSPVLDDDEVVITIFKKTYSAMPPKGVEIFRFEKIEGGSYIDAINTKYLYNLFNNVSESGLFPLVNSLYMAFIYIEMNVSPKYLELYKQCLVIISEELKRLGITWANKICLRARSVNLYQVGNILMYQSNP